MKSDIRESERSTTVTLLRYLPPAPLPRLAVDCGLLVSPMLMVTLLSDDAAYAAPPSPMITDVLSPGLELISMEVFCSGSAGYPVTLSLETSSGVGDTCTTVLFSSSPWPPDDPLPRRNSSVTAGVATSSVAGADGRSSSLFAFVAVVAVGGGGGGGGGGSAGLSNAARLSGLFLCRTWIRIVSLNTVTSSDPLPDLCLSLKLRFSFLSTAATIVSENKYFYHSKSEYVGKCMWSSKKILNMHTEAWSKEAVIDLGSMWGTEYFY